MLVAYSSIYIFVVQSHIHILILTHLYISISIPYLNLYLAYVSNTVNLCFSYMMPFWGILYLIEATAHSLSTNDVITQILPWPSFPLLLQLFSSWHNHELWCCTSCTPVSVGCTWFILTEQSLKIYLFCGFPYLCFSQEFPIYYLDHL